MKTVFCCPLLAFSSIIFRVSISVCLVRKRFDDIFSNAKEDSVTRRE
jgi:hypothetical protein